MKTTRQLKGNPGRGVAKSFTLVNLVSQLLFLGMGLRKLHSWCRHYLILSYPWRFLCVVISFFTGLRSRKRVARASPERAGRKYVGNRVVLFRSPVQCDGTMADRPTS